MLFPECSSTLSGPPFSLLLPVKFCWLKRSTSWFELFKLISVLAMKTSWSRPIWYVSKNGASRFRMFAGCAKKFGGSTTFGMFERWPS
jgi:hypothetical protein